MSPSRLANAAVYEMDKARTMEALLGSQRIVISQMEVPDGRAIAPADRDALHRVDDKIVTLMQWLKLFKPQCPSRCRECPLIARFPVGIAQYLQGHAMPSIEKFTRPFVEQEHTSIPMRPVAFNNIYVQ